MGSKLLNNPHIWHIFYRVLMILTIKMIQVVEFIVILHHQSIKKLRNTLLKSYLNEEVFNIDRIGYCLHELPE